jgi:general secretion pathway protein J
MRMRGFTLIELLVALFITAIMMAMGYGVVNQVTKGRIQLQQQTARIISLQRALRMLEQDIALMQPRPVRDPLGGSTDLPALKAMPAAQLTAASVSASSAASSSSSNSSSSAASITVSSLNLQSTAALSLTRGGWANPVGIARPEEQRVSYQIENAKLVRYHFAVLDATGESPMTRVELIDNVVSVSFRFMDSSHAWQNDWQLIGSSRQTQRHRPLAVEVTLVLKDLGKIVRVVEVAG